MASRSRTKPLEPSRAKPSKTKVNFRIEEGDRNLFERAADTQHETLTRFLIESGRERAERILADRRTFTVGKDEWEAIVAAMDRPAEAKPELVDLFSRPEPQ